MSIELEALLERSLRLVRAGRLLEALPDLRRTAELRGHGDGPWLYRAIRDDVAGGDLDAARRLHQDATTTLVDREYLPALAAALLPVVPRSEGEMRTMREAYERAVAALDGSRERFEETKLVALPTQFGAAYQGRPSRLQQEQVARFYAEACPSLAVTPALAVAAGPLRIGFVSSHFYNHTIGKLTRGLIAELHRKRFETHVFSPRAPDDEIGRFIASSCAHFTTLTRDLAEARAIIAAAGLDVLVYPDIGMEPFTYFLAFARLAPVQCVQWGHPVTTGIPNLDYFLSSEEQESADEAIAQAHYSERLVRPSQPLPYLYPIQAGALDEGPDLAVATDRTLYVCVQPPMKFHPAFDRALIEILSRDPNGTLVLIDFEPAPTRALLARLGVVASRIHIVPRLSQNAFLGLLRAAHVVLDTSHFSGGISSIEALGQGKAVVTWPHPDQMPARITYAYYRQMGLDVGVARDLDDYVALAVRLGTDPSFRAEAEAKIAARAARLFRQDQAVREFEEFLVRVSPRAAPPSRAPAF